MRSLLSLVLLLLLSFTAHAAPNPDWTTSIAPFQISDNLYYVGSRDLAAYLITTPAGNILINANLESSPPQIRASVERLGFHWQDTKILLNGQAHYDHMAGAAQILRETHAKDMVMEGDAEVIRTGGRADWRHVSVVRARLARSDLLGRQLSGCFVKPGMHATKHAVRRVHVRFKARLFREHAFCAKLATP